MSFRTLSLAAATALTLGAPQSVPAHHAFAAEFSRDMPLDLTGTVTKVEWMNPHARFYIDVDDGSGNPVSWDFELGSPNVLMRRGWTRNSLQLGDVVTVTGFRARNDPHVGNATSVTLASGQKVFAGSSSERDN
jgi:hypothetical protein